GRGNDPILRAPHEQRWRGHAVNALAQAFVWNRKDELAGGRKRAHALDVGAALIVLRAGVWHVCRCDFSRGVGPGSAMKVARWGGKYVEGRRLVEPQPEWRR